MRVPAASSEVSGITAIRASAGRRLWTLAHTSQSLYDSVSGLAPLGVAHWGVAPLFLSLSGKI